MTDPIDTEMIAEARRQAALGAVMPDLADRLIDEVDRLRAEVAQLDAICAAQRAQYQPPIDEEFGVWVGGLLCEHPSVTGDRCDACGEKREAHRD